MKVFRRLLLRKTEFRLFSTSTPKREIRTLEELPDREQPSYHSEFNMCDWLGARI